ncbi:hypothetical protein GDO86_006232 [Hymenochirus boettgeri]|uniref:U3 small nucleolar ribonucleoprotein protein MPP10 n=1 Tax=Hymenochirus boettgeri TaxID=247094 RepID=A0A8T2J599_9PIPI|nr:hypothetical protein GDO86_006232 [Hymenochirus boettgeri]
MMAKVGDLRAGLEQGMELLDNVSAHPEQLLSVQAELASGFCHLTKALYDLQKSKLVLQVGSPLEELMVENFDEEQIWQQLELQNSSVLNYFKNAVSNTLKDKDLCLVHLDEEESSASEEEEESIVAEKQPGIRIERNIDGKIDEINKSDHKLTQALKRTEEGSFSDDDSDVDFNIDKLEKENRKKKDIKLPVRSSEKSIVDDKFFKMAEMEAFLEAVEKDQSDKEDEDEVDYFDDVDSDDAVDEEFLIANIKKKVAKSSRDFCYKDFFDPVEGEEENNEGHLSENDEEEENDQNDISQEYDQELSEFDEEEEQMEETEESQRAKEAFKRVTFDLSDASEGEDIGEILGGKKQDLPEPTEVRSSFEKREEKMTEKIQTLQKQMLEEKPWQLTGEVTAQKRPENSLLSESLIFDHASKMAPIITEETTMQIEDIIKQRIKDQVWDDVVRKEKPKENTFEYKKRLTLDHDKSKLSLAEIYEQEYIKLNEKKKEEEENPKHVEIKKIMDSLFLKLDALSNFHFTPKPPVPEIRVVSNLPAISMEEVAPVSVSEATLLAPEEIKEKNKAGDLKTDAEKTATDKKRERRKKKTVKRLKIKEREKRQQQAEKIRAEKGNKGFSKDAAAASLKKLTKEGKATILKDEGKDKALKSSQAFFSQLQDQVKLQIKGVKSAQKKPKKENQLSVHKLKL